jgi:alpha-L-rhamnosidase
MNWVYTVAAGIKVDENNPGYSRMTIQPHADKRLGWLRVKLQTVNGEVSSAWTYEKDLIRYEISTPVPAKIIIGSKEYDVEPGKYMFCEEV